MKHYYENNLWLKFKQHLMLIFKNSLPNYCLPDAEDSEKEYFLKGRSLKKNLSD